MSGSKSSKPWLRRHVTDSYVRRAREQGYRSRSAYKLIDINAKARLLHPGSRVVDLGAAPGGWSQVAAQCVRPGGAVFAVDLLPIAPISGVTVLTGDVRTPETLDALRAAVGGVVDVVLSDLSSNLSGIRNVDQARAAELVEVAADFAGGMLKPGGAFLAKAFHGESYQEVVEMLKERFIEVAVRKPPASRGESRETYLIARNLRAERNGPKSGT